MNLCSMLYSGECLIFILTLIYSRMLIMSIVNCSEVEDIISENNNIPMPLYQACTIVPYNILYYKYKRLLYLFYYK